MSKVRVLVAEMEGSDEAVRAVVSGFTELMKEKSGGANVVSLPVVEAAAALPAPAGEDLSPQRRGDAEKKHRKIGRPKKVKAAAPAPPAREMVNGLGGFPKRTGKAPDPDATPAQVIAQLQKEPMTTAELLMRLPKCSADTVYAALGYFRKNGRVQTITDSETGEKKNKLVG